MVTLVSSPTIIFLPTDVRLVTRDSIKPIQQQPFKNLNQRVNVVSEKTAVQVRL